MTEDPYAGVAPLFDLATNWTDRIEGANLPLALAVHQLRSTGNWRLSIYRTGAEIEGVSVVCAGGDWYVDARHLSAAVFLAHAAAVHGQRPKALVTTDGVAALLRPVLADKGAIAREHKLHILRCTEAPARGAGRWATDADLPALERYAQLVERELRNGGGKSSWRALVARRDLAVVASGDAIVASIRRYGPAPSFAAVSNPAVDPRVRGEPHAANLTAFIVGELLATRKAVYAFADEAETAFLDLYAALGFQRVGTCYKADLK